MENFDDENEFIVEGDDSGIKKREVLVKNRLLKELRGHLTEEDMIALKKVKTKLYGHLNIDKLAQ